MQARPHFTLLARYGLWATRRLFEHVDALSDEEYRRDAGLFFKSVHGTLNHLLAAEHAHRYLPAESMHGTLSQKMIRQ